MTVLAEFRGGFTVSLKYFGGFTVFGTPYDPHYVGFVGVAFGVTFAL